MADQSLTLITALASAITGGALTLMSVMLTNHSSTNRLKLQFGHETAQRRAEVLRERGEELYVLSEQWLNGLTGYYLRKTSVMQGKLTYNQCLDLEIADGKENPVNFSRIELLIDVYFPSARPDYEQITKGRDTLNLIAAEHKRAYATGDIDGTPYRRPFQQAMEAIHAAAPAFKNRLLESIRAI
jgi:hypothetical protein